MLPFGRTSVTTAAETVHTAEFALGEDCAVFDEEGKRYLYRAKVTRSACVRKESRSFLDRVFSGNEAALLEHFVKASKLSAKEIEELKRILDQQEASDE